MALCEQCSTCDNSEYGGAICTVCYPLPVVKDGKCDSYFPEKVALKNSRGKKDAKKRD